MERRNKVMGKIAVLFSGQGAQYVRLGLQQGILKFGTAIKVGSSNEFSYYCPDKRVWEETGYFNDKAG